MWEGLVVRWLHLKGRVGDTLEPGVWFFNSRTQETIELSWVGSRGGGGEPFVLVPSLKEVVGAPSSVEGQCREELFSFRSLGQTALNRGDWSCSSHGGQTEGAEARKAPKRHSHSKLGDQGHSVRDGMDRIRDEAAPACLV